MTAETRTMAITNSSVAPPLTENHFVSVNLVDATIDCPDGNSPEFESWERK